ncbi:FecR family protein [Variovorax sp. MHTC-1]|uniref:FecR family protein n=1 Tax=Variovorax sp. MHTC-1 TaxID=2495593 RepID=UPI000F8865F1|nr:FecR domain-containing protein [Variovorax sp. MHTC-1]RST53045.1 iron dicitrate transport regulator FecR [Variovorax sp. MHTC-1]
MAIPRSEKLVEHALTLIVRSEGASPASAELATAALREWRAASPTHEAAAVEAQQRWDALGGLASDLRDCFAEPDTRIAAARGRQRRNLVLSVAGLIGTGVLAGKGFQWYWQQPLFAADFSTQTAQLRKVLLPDGSPGSRVELSAQSKVTVRLYRQRRVVDFAGGEARFEVAADAQRPFEVRTRDAVIRVIGTAFTVRDRGGPILVAVERGKVRVTVRQRRGDADASSSMESGVDLQAGEALSLRDGVPDPVQQVDAASLAAWREGWLVFDATPLGEALETINAYRPQPILSPDPRVNALRLSGRFRANGSASLVDALPMTLPVIAQTHPDGSVTLRAR